MIASLHLPDNYNPAHAPKHVAIIMDGNGRWAKKRGLPRSLGHKRGAESLRELLKQGRVLGVEHLTVYAFSEENWERPQEEVSALMNLLEYYLQKEVPTLVEHGIALRVIGDVAKLPAELQTLLHQAHEQTHLGASFHLNLCLSYGSHQEITRAVQQVAARMQPDAITSNDIAGALYTSSLPPLDLLIRTGGEQRLSNFLLWQAAYAELYFTPVLWPDFTPDHLLEACVNFSNRERRYGKV